MCLYNHIKRRLTNSKTKSKRFSVPCPPNRVMKNPINGKATDYVDVIFRPDPNVDELVIENSRFKQREDICLRVAMDYAEKCNKRKYMENMNEEEVKFEIDEIYIKMQSETMSIKEDFDDFMRKERLVDIGK